MMRGTGGPLLCIGDLLSDVGEGEGDGDTGTDQVPPSSSSISNLNDYPLRSLDLNQQFQENYNKLNEALAGNDHSWTALTLKLCTALETADKLVQSANSNVTLLSEKVEVLESIVRRGDSAVKAVKVIQGAQNKKDRPSVGSSNIK